MIKTYDLVYSIGEDCSCATYLKRAELRTYSSPFDWNKGLVFKEKINFIINDFENFLNKEDLEPLEKDLSKMVVDRKNDYYRNKRNNIYFIHDFPINISIDNSFNDVKNKYDRRIERFYKKIKTSNRVLLVYFSHYDNPSNDEIISAQKKLYDKFKKNINILVILNDETIEKGIVKKEELNNYIEKYTLYTKTFFENGEPTVDGNIEECMKIFTQFKLKLPFYKKHLFIKYFSRFLSSFIPSKRLRKKFRTRLNYS